MMKMMVMMMRRMMMMMSAFVKRKINGLEMRYMYIVALT